MMFGMSVDWNKVLIERIVGFLRKVNVFEQLVICVWVFCVVEQRLFVNVLSKMIMMDGGMICFKVFEVVIIFVVSFGEQLLCNIVGKDNSFMVIIVVFIILVEVVRNVFIIIIDIVRFLGSGLNICVMVVNRLLVILECFSVMFIRINISIVSRVLIDWLVRICLFIWFMIKEILWFIVVF